jgi:hypothetical protein
VIQRVPLEHHKTGRDVDLLHFGVHDLARMAGQEHGRLRDDVCLALRGDQKLVQVRVQAVGRVDGGDLAVVVVEDHAHAAAAA